MNTILRNIIAVIAGLVLGGIVNMALVTVGPLVIAPPAGLDVTDAESLSASAHLLQPQHFIMPFLAHALGTLAGALTAFVIAASHKRVFAYVIGSAFLAGGVAASFMIPAPAWFIALDLAGAYLPMAWLGVILGMRIAGGAGEPAQET